MRKVHISRFIALLSLGFLAETQAVDIYVSPSGKDSANGHRDQPVATLSRARDLARTYAGKEPVTVHVADGCYYLPETLVFTAADSGTEGNPVVYRAEHEGGAVISGGMELSLRWEPYRDGIFQAATPAGLEMDQLFVNGQRQRMARYPDYDSSRPTAAYQGYAADAFSKERAARWADPAGGYIHAMHKQRWGGYHYRITGKDADGNIVYEGGWQNNRQMGMHEEFRMVENIFEELDAAGEWFHDAKKNRLYFKPPKGLDLNRATIEGVRLRHLIEFQGSEEAPVRFITLQGFTVRHAARTFMDTREPMLRSDWTIYRGGALFLTGTEDIHILDTEFDQVGGNAVFVSNYNRRTRVRGCHIYDAGASGVCFVGDPDAVRNPLFEYHQSQDLDGIDRTPGPKSSNYPADGAVEDCLIHGMGRTERQTAAVQIQMAMNITVRDCSIYDCSRAGINIGGGCWGGHLIERCDVFDTVLETHDHGSFNSWGRDRFWLSDRSVSQKAIDQDPGLPFLDAMKTTVIRNSRWRCDHGWDIDLDDGSSNYDVYNNLMLNGGLKFREGFRRRAWNNIAVARGFFPHVWYANSRDEVFANIFMDYHRGVRVPTATARGKKVDENLFIAPDPEKMRQLASFGWDVNSRVGDPLFMNPEEGDFRVREGSPALELGFRNFPMDQFGVKKPALKALARTPVIPDYRALVAEKRERIQQKIFAEKADGKDAAWAGARLKDLEEQQFSAYGVGKEEGGVVLVSVEKNSAAAKAGLRAGDLIQAVNGRPVSNCSELFAALENRRSADIKLKVIRNQSPAEFVVRL